MDLQKPVLPHYNVYCVTRERAYYVDARRNDNVLRLPLIFIYDVRYTTYYMLLNYSSFSAGVLSVYLRNFKIAFQPFLFILHGDL